jgi:hypothetical protein
MADIEENWKKPKMQVVEHKTSFHEWFGHVGELDWVKL